MTILLLKVALHYITLTITNYHDWDSPETTMFSTNKTHNPNLKNVTVFWPWDYLMKVILDPCRSYTMRYLCFYYYNWLDIFTGWLLVFRGYNLFRIRLRLQSLNQLSSNNKRSTFLLKACFFYVQRYISNYYLSL
jgi:hypothetical protein